MGCCGGGGHDFGRKGNVSWTAGKVSAEKNVVMVEGQVSSEKGMLRGWRAGFHPKRGGHSFIRKGNVARAEGIVLSEKGMFRGRRARFHPKR